MSGGRVIWLAFAVFALSIILLGVWVVDRRNDREDACTQLGGVAVKSHGGPLVCIRRDALIDTLDAEALGKER